MVHRQVWKHHGPDVDALVIALLMDKVGTVKSGSIDEMIGRQRIQNPLCWQSEDLEAYMASNKQESTCSNAVLSLGRWH